MIKLKQHEKTLMKSAVKDTYFFEIEIDDWTWGASLSNAGGWFIIWPHV